MLVRGGRQGTSIRETLKLAGAHVRLPASRIEEKKSSNLYLDAFRQSKFLLELARHAARVTNVL
jgi:hypothetical protein